MKFISFESSRGIGVGLATRDGIIDLAGRINASSLRALIEERRLQEASAFANEKPDFSFDEVKFLPVVPDPHHIFCIGTNYLDHLHEVQKAGVSRPVPKRPPLFVRYPETLVGHNQPLVHPKVSEQFDYEAELAVIIGKPGRYIAEDAALSYVAGYSCFNDGSIRDWQFHTTQVTPGKNFFSTGSFGPWMVEAASVPDPHKLDIVFRLNGKILQNSNTQQLIFKIPTLIAYVSAVLPLRPGDVIATGTPAGVGFSREPPIFMKPGDICEVEIETIGTLRNMVVAETN